MLGLIPEKSKLDSKKQTLTSSEFAHRTAEPRLDLHGQAGSSPHEVCADIPPARHGSLPAPIAAAAAGPTPNAERKKFWKARGGMGRILRTDVHIAGNVLDRGSAVRSTMDVRRKLLTGSRCGEFISLPPGKLLVGRDHDCDLQIEIPLVSRHHCLLVWDESGLRIRDLRIRTAPTSTAAGSSRGRPSCCGTTTSFRSARSTWQPSRSNYARQLLARPVPRRTGRLPTIGPCVAPRRLWRPRHTLSRAKPREPQGLAAFSTAVPVARPPSSDTD